MPWMPLGWVAASGVVAGPGTFELISTQVLASNTTSISFSLTGTQQTTYKHLQIRSTERGNQAGTGLDSMWLRFNSDSASNYSEHALEGIGSGTPGSGGTPNNTRIGIGGGNTASTTATANAFSVHVTDILDAFSTSKNKTTRTLGGISADNFRITLYSGAWYSTSAVSSITLSLGSGSSFIVGSRFSLYGVRA